MATSHSSATHATLERSPGNDDNWIERLPKSLQRRFHNSWIYRAAKHLNYDRGMSIGHAFGVAVNAAKKGCSTGDLNWSGKQSVNPKSRSEMCASVATWSAMKAANVGKSAAHDAGLIHKRRDVTDHVLCDLLARDGIVKRDFSSEQRESLADKGKAMPNGSYPIKNCEDVNNAWKLRSHSNTYSQSQIESHIKSAAKSLGCSVPGSDDSEETSKSLTAATATISKVDEDQQLVFGWASVGSDKDGNLLVDKQGDVLDDPEEIAKAAYDFVLHSRDGGEQHIRKGVSTLVESFVSTPDKLEKMGVPQGTLPTGWWTGWKVHDLEVWEKVKKGEYTGFSVHGSGHREVIEGDE